MKLVKCSSNDNEKKSDNNEIDFEALDKIVRGAEIAISSAIDELKTSPSVATIEEIHICFLENECHSNASVLQKILSLIDLMTLSPDYYRQILIFYSDVVHFNSLFASMLIDKNIFDHLKYSTDLCFGFVFSMCDNHKEARDLFFKKYYKSEYQSDKMISRLMEKNRK